MILSIKDEDVYYTVHTLSTIMRMMMDRNTSAVINEMY